MSPPNLTTTHHSTPEQIEGMDVAERERLDEIEALTGSREDGARRTEEGAEEDPLRRQEPAAEEEPEVPMSPGDRARLAIASRFKREADPVPFDGDMTNPENLYGEVARETLEPDPDADEPGANANGGTTPPPAERTHEVTIRGVKKVLTDKQLLDHAMRVEAGDSYLAEARDLLEKAKTVKDERAAPDSQRPEDRQRADDEPDDTNSAPRRPGDKRKEVVEKLQFGDPDDAAAALDDYVGEAVTKAIDDSQTRRLTNNDIVKSQAALKEFIAANPKLAASKEVSQLIENGVYEVYREELIGLGLAPEVVPTDPRDVAKWATHYRVQGHAVSNAKDVLEKAKARVLPVINPDIYRDEPAPKPRGAPVVQVDVNRTQRREAIQTQPSRAVAPKPNPTKAEQPKSRSEVIAEMRRSRGQAT